MFERVHRVTVRDCGDFRSAFRLREAPSPLGAVGLISSSPRLVAIASLCLMAQRHLSTAQLVEVQFAAAARRCLGCFHQQPVPRSADSLAVGAPARLIRHYPVIGRHSWESKRIFRR